MKRLLCALFGLMFTIPAMAATLPSGYTELEYIQSDGTNWIETNYRGTEKTGAYLRYQYHSLSKDLSGRVFGYRISTDHQWVTYIGTMAGTTIDTTTYYVQSGALETSPEGLPTLDTEIHEFRINTDGSGEVLFDGALFGNSNGATAFTASQTLRIFSAYNNSQYSNATARIYAVSIYENGVLQKNFVPAKHGNDVGMYETVVGTFYQKSGEHDFVAGPVVCPNGGTAQTYTSATGTVTQNGTPTPATPITPTFYTQGNMVLRKVGNIADSYDATTGKITRRVGIRTFNGSEDWNAYVSVPERGYYIGVGAGIPVKLGVSMENQGILSSHFKYYKWTNNTEPMPTNSIGLNINASNGSVTNGNMTIKPDTTAFPTVESWKTWLSSHPITVYYQLPEETTEDWPATQCESGNTCNNLFVADNTTQGYYIDATGTPKSDISANYYEYPVTPGQTYTWSGICGHKLTSNNKRVHGYANGVWQQQITMQAIDSGEPYSITFEVPQGITSIRLSFWNDDTMVKLEEGSTATTYCRAPGKIKIATTKYNNAAFSGVVTALSNAVDTIKTVVANTINQATAVANLHSGKQTKPTDTCPNGKICLLVEDDNGTPHWYEIIERAPGIVPANSGYTQVEYLQSDGNQRIDLNLSGNANFVIDAQATSDASRVLIASSASASAGTWVGSYNDTVYWSVGNRVMSTIKKTIRTSIDVNFTSSGVSAKFNNETKSLSATVTQGDWSLFSSSNGSYGYIGKVWSLTATQNGVMVRDMVPARRNSDGVLGMYDTVSGNFFTNAGTGKFYAPDQYIPSTYTRLEYIESTGTQYIDTGIQDTSKLEMRINLTEYNSNYTLVYGSQKTYSPVTRRLIIANKDHKYLGVTTGSANQTTTPLSADNTFTTNTWHNVTAIFATNPSITLDGIEYVANSTTDNASTGLKDYLFCYNYGGSSNFNVKAKISYAKIWGANGTPVRELVPVRRNSDNELGMYDCVNGVFYDNDGSGDFLAPGESGSSLPAGYTQLQYIQSDGGAYIDTGLYGTLNTEAEIDVHLDETTNTSVNRIFGNFTNSAKAITINGSNSADNFSRFGDKSQQANIYSSERSVYKINKTNLTRNGVVLMTFDTTTPFTTEGTLLVGSSTSAGGGVVGKLYSAIIRENGNVVMHLVPVQYGTSIGMYDLVNNQFLRKSGTGELTAGPVAQ